MRFFKNDLYIFDISYKWDNLVKNLGSSQMPELLIKSKQNIISASLLIDNGLNASSIHCSYYAGFQKLKNTIAKIYNLSYEQLETEMNLLNNSLPPGRKVATHQFLIDKKLLQYIKDRHPEQTRLLSVFNDIKKYRVDSDYKNISIDPEKARESFKLAELVIEQLNQFKR